MKNLAATLIASMSLVICHAAEPTVVVSERPEWQKQVLDKVSFRIEAKGIEELLGAIAAHPNNSWQGFVIFSCTAKENLGKRLLWIDAEVEFSNGYKRKFEGISFNILTKGTEYDIAKIPFEVEDPVSVKSVTISSVTIK
jgi:hypothetical protein